MDETAKLFDDPVVRALLWCLLEDAELSEEALQASGFSEDETLLLLADKGGRPWPHLPFDNMNWEYIADAEARPPHMPDIPGGGGPWSRRLGAVVGTPDDH